MALKSKAETNRSVHEDVTSLPTNMQSFRLLNNFSGNELSVDDDKSNQ